MPIQKIWIPPRKYIGSTMDVQPGTTLSVKTLTHNAHNVTSMLPRKMTKPASVIIRSGITENEVIAFRASAIIFLSGYFDSPAKRLVRS